MAQKTIKNGSEKLEEILSLEKQLDDQRDIIEAIAKRTIELGDPVSKDEIWLDIPKTPKTKEGSACVIRNPGSQDGYTLLRAVFPVSDWVSAFTEYKWKAYVFTVDEHTETVYKAAKFVFEELYEIELNDSARTLCKIDSDIPSYEACATE